MKKLLAILTVAVFVFAACGPKNVETTEPADVVTEEMVITETPVDEVAPVADETETTTEEMPAE